MWRQLSGQLRGHCREENEKADSSLALRERRHWVEVLSMENTLVDLRNTCDAGDQFLFLVLVLW
ncbi:hypothetical protein PHMEG_00028872 [Phytophthora megakarya]|uniref:Uncharacterized protein n=1 Tax=Phytophthora megakarya TaxID=4795 RepID=A0A225V299_9STRA|nr:hypothetical protein PHMEG_00028872 [Phytophthora megakarya]